MKKAASVKLQILWVSGIGVLTFCATYISALLLHSLKSSRPDNHDLQVLSGFGLSVSNVRTPITIANWTFFLESGNVAIHSDKSVDLLEPLLREVLMKIASRIEAFRCPRVVIDDSSAVILGQMVNLNDLLVTVDGLSVSGAQRLTGINRLEFVELRGRAVSDATCAWLADNYAMRSLRLGVTSIGDVTLLQCRKMPELKFLDVTDTAVTDAGFLSLAGSGDKIHFSQLHYVAAANTRLTNASITAFLCLPVLETLYLDGCRITDEGVARLLCGSRSIKSLGIAGCDVDVSNWGSADWEAPVEVLNIGDTKSAGRDILDMIRAQDSIESVIYNGCDFSDDEGPEIGELLAEHRRQVQRHVVRGTSKNP